jgi:hypothetical protein
LFASRSARHNTLQMSIAHRQVPLPKFPPLPVTPGFHNVAVMKRVLGLIVLVASVAMAQEGSRGEVGSRATVDSNIVFPSPRPLIEPLENSAKLHAFGIDIIFSNNGYGAGIFYRRVLSHTWAAFATFFISGARNGDEFSSYDPYADTVVAPLGKVNRLYMIPATIGIQYRLFSEAITETFRPFLDAGIGPAVLVAAPYQLEFFSSIGHASVYVAPDMFVGIGANFGNERRSMMGVNFRFYYIPFPRGLESVKGRPITDFGGFMLSAHFGWPF